MISNHLYKFVFYYKFSQKNSIIASRLNAVFSLIVIYFFC